MIVCIAKDYQEFAKWRDEKVVYVGDSEDLSHLDPAEVSQIRLIGQRFSEHPIYFSDAFLKFQIEVAANKSEKPKRSLRRRFKRG